MSKYTQGIASEGVLIFKDGQAMTSEEIISELKQSEERKALLKEVADYLDINELTQFSSTSLFHIKFRENG